MVNRIYPLGQGAYTVPVEPEARAWSEDGGVIAGTQRTLDGSLQAFYVAAKRKWKVSWAGMSWSDSEALLGRLTSLGLLTWEPPQGGSFTVKAAGVTRTPTEGTPDRYTVACDLEQA